MHRCLLIAAAFAALASPPPSKSNEPRAVNDGYLDLVYVPAGQFRMGDNFGDGESRERPVHIVDLDAFYIGKYEVTNGDWRKFRDDPGYNDPKFC
jgi:formylglycine-generating enzyme required for sulfatase activity